MVSMRTAALVVLTMRIPKMEQGGGRPWRASLEVSMCLSKRMKLYLELLRVACVVVRVMGLRGKEGAYLCFECGH